MVRAIDINIRDDIKHPKTDDLTALRVTAERLRTGRDPRIHYVIHDRRIFSSYPHGDTPAWTWRPYSHSNTMPHLTHVHVSVSPSGDHDHTPVKTGKPEPGGGDWCEVGKPPTDQEVLKFVLTHTVWKHDQAIAKTVQLLVGATPDGIWGPNSQKAFNVYFNDKNK